MKDERTEATRIYLRGIKKERRRHLSDAQARALIGQTIIDDGKLGTVLSHDNAQFVVDFGSGDIRKLPELRVRGMRETYLFNQENQNG